MPAVALTGIGMENDLRRTRHAGFNDHLTKPVAMLLLEEAIQRNCIKGDSPSAAHSPPAATTD